MNHNAAPRILAVVLLAAPLAGCLGPAEDTPTDDVGLGIQRIANQTLVGAQDRENATHIDPWDAERRVPFLVQALRKAREEGTAQITDSHEAQATVSYLEEKSWRYGLLEFEGVYFHATHAVT